LFSIVRHQKIDIKNQINFRKTYDKYCNILPSILLLTFRIWIWSLFTKLIPLIPPNRYFEFFIQDQCHEIINFSEFQVEFLLYFLADLHFISLSISEILSKVSTDHLLLLFCYFSTTLFVFCQEEFPRYVCIIIPSLFLLEIIRDMLRLLLLLQLLFLPPSLIFWSLEKFQEKLKNIELN